MKKIVIMVLVAVLVAVGVIMVVKGTNPADNAAQVETTAPKNIDSETEAIDETEAQDEPNVDAEPEMVGLEGFVTEIGESHFVITCVDGSMLQANQTAETVMNTGAPLAIGDYVTVYHNGNTTRSIPPQAAAIAVNGAYVCGIVSELEQERFLLTQEDGNQLVVNLPDALTCFVQNGMYVTVYYNGMMTFSLPAQITAAHVRGHVMEGVITDVTAEQITLDLGEDIAVFNYSESTRLFVNLDTGMKVQIVTTGTATMSLPAQYTALEVLPARTK